MKLIFFADNLTNSLDKTLDMLWIKKLFVTMMEINKVFALNINFENIILNDGKQTFKNYPVCKKLRFELIVQ